jgi:triacylglycerol esterase/lipase EstA (alpha/beta hydrolase family)
MIKRLLLLLLALQAGAAAAIAASLHAGAGWRLAAALAAGLGAVLLVRLLISANNFALSWRARSIAPAEHALTPGRALRLFLYEFVSSMLTSSWTMLHPIGLRLQPAGKRLPVLLLHGYGCNSGYWTRMSALLADAGISHYGLDLEPPGAGIDDFVPQVEAGIARLCAETGSQQVILLCHSMGGLVARAYLRRHGHARVARVITLGSPHHGTALACFGPGQNAAQMRPGSAWLAALAAAEANLQRNLFCSIYSVHDNIVAPQDSSQLPGARNLPMGAIGHVALGRHPAVLRRALAEIEAAGPGDFV